MQPAEADYNGEVMALTPGGVEHEIADWEPDVYPPFRRVNSPSPNATKFFLWMALSGGVQETGSSPPLWLNIVENVGRAAILLLPFFYVLNLSRLPNRKPNRNPHCIAVILKGGRSCFWNP